MSTTDQIFTNDNYRDGDRFDWSPAVCSPVIDTCSSLVTDHLAKHSSSNGISPADIVARNDEYRAIARQMLAAMHNAATKRFPIRSGAISVPLGNSYYSKRDDANSLGKIKFSARHTNDVLEAFKQLGLVGELVGEHRKGFTRIWPVGDLLEALEKEVFHWHKQEPFPANKGMELYDGKRKKGIKGKTPSTAPKRVTITEDISELQNNLHRYNSFIVQYCIALDLTDEQLEQIITYDKNAPDSDTQVRYIDFSRVQLVRKFSRGSLEFHGRFYGGWWQNIPSIFRKHITINGKKTRELDFSGIVPRILYAKKGLQLPIDRDVYDIGLPGWKGGDDPRRGVVKQYLNALINDEDTKYKLSPSELSKVGMTQAELYAYVEKSHTPIIDSFGTTDGLKAMRTDSDIAMTVMLECADRGIPALPIHDSFIVPAGFTHDLIEVMRTAFTSHTGKDIGLKFDPVGSREVFKQENSVLSRSALPSGRIVSMGELREVVKLPVGHTHMGRFVSSWELQR